jgi:hypothetical protein
MALRGGFSGFGHRLDTAIPPTFLAKALGGAAGGVHSGAPMAVENDYNLLVHNLNELAKTISSLRDEVERRRLAEARQRLDLNDTD